MGKKSRLKRERRGLPPRTPSFREDFLWGLAGGAFFGIVALGIGVMRGMRAAAAGFTIRDDSLMTGAVAYVLGATLTGGIIGLLGRFANTLPRRALLGAVALSPTMLLFLYAVGELKTARDFLVMCIAAPLLGAFTARSGQRVAVPAAESNPGAARERRLLSSRDTKNLIHERSELAMDPEIPNGDDSTLANLTNSPIMIRKPTDILDLFGEGITRFVLEDRQLADEFFDLSSGFAGELVQKCSNYGLRAAIVGEFEGGRSSSFQQFARESNRGKHFVFVRTVDEAMARLMS